MAKLTTTLIAPFGRGEAAYNAVYQYMLDHGLGGTLDKKRRFLATDINIAWKGTDEQIRQAMRDLAQFVEDN